MHMMSICNDNHIQFKLIGEFFPEGVFVDNIQHFV